MTFRDTQPKFLWAWGGGEDSVYPGCCTQPGGRPPSYQAAEFLPPSPFSSLSSLLHPTLPPPSPYPLFSFWICDLESHFVALAGHEHGILLTQPPGAGITSLVILVLEFSMDILLLIHPVKWLRS